MHTVIETEAYQRSAIASGLSEQERLEISNYVSANPSAGVIMKGTGERAKSALPVGARARAADIG